MPQSYVQFTGNGSNRTFSFAGIDDYLSTGYLKVYIDNQIVATTNYDIDTSGGNENVVFTVAYGAPVSGAVVKIARETPSTSASFAANIVDFTDGSVLTASDLDKGFKGLLHIVQEANDTGSGALGKTVDGLAWDAQGLRITNGGQGSSDKDFVTKAQLDAAQLFGTAVTAPQAWSFTGNNSSVDFLFSDGNGGTGPDRANATDPNMFIVEVGGVLQRPTTDYTITQAKLTFATAPGNGVGIRVRNFGVARNAVDTLPNGVITNEYMAANSIATVNLQDGSVTTPKLATSAVTEAKLGSAAVTSTKVAADAIATASIQNLAVTEGKIADGAVSNQKIAALAVTEAKIGSGAVTSSKMGSNAISFVNMNTQSGASAFASGGNNRYMRVSSSGVLTLTDETSLPVGTPTGNISFSNQYKCINLQSPTNAGDSATKGYVDSQLSATVYTGSDADNQTWPVGSTLLATSTSTITVTQDGTPGQTVQLRLEDSSTFLARNGVVAVWVKSSEDTDTFRFVFPGGFNPSGGTWIQLTGTWRYRGLAYHTGANPGYVSILVQRVS